MNEALELTLMIYLETSIDDIIKLEDKIASENNQFTENEEMLLLFREHFEDYFSKQFENKIVSKEGFLKLIKENSILKYVIQIMKEIEEGKIHKRGDSTKHPNPEDIKEINDEL